MDVGTDDDGVYIDAYWQYSFDAKAADRAKRSKDLFVEDSSATVTPFAVSIDVDNTGTFTAYTEEKISGIQRKYDFKTGFRYISVKLEHKLAGLAEICSLVVPFKIKDKSGL